MWNHHPYHFTLSEVQKLLVDNIPFPFCYVNSSCAFQKTECWIYVLLSKEEIGIAKRRFDLKFHFYLPDFPFYYKPYVYISVKEFFSEETIYKTIQVKEQRIKLNNMQEDNIYAEKQTETSITWSIHKDGCTKNAQYVFDNIKIAYTTLKSFQL